MQFKRIVTDDRGVHMRSGNSVLCEFIEDSGESSVKFVEEAKVAGYLKGPPETDSSLRGEEVPDKKEAAPICKKGPPLSPGKKKDAWTKGETDFLLQSYALYYPEIGPMKMFRNQKLMWEKVSEELNEKFGTAKTGIQCQNKYKYEADLRKTAIKNNRRSGMAPMDSPYEDSFSKIESFDDNLKPEVLVGIGRNERLKRAGDNDDGKSRAKQSKMELARELHAISEDNRERRHKERCELFKQLFQKRED